MRSAFLLVAALLAANASAWGGSPSAIPARDFGTFAVRQKLGGRLPLGLILRDSGGRPAVLRDMFGKTPVLIDFDYARCTTLCGVLLDRVTAALRALPLRPERDYRLVAVDIDPATTPAQAADFSRRHGAAGPGFQTLTGEAATIAKLAAAAGFPDRRDPATGQFAHPGGFLIATADGRIARYFLGFDWRPLDIRLALDAAAGGRIAAPSEPVLLLCYCYDPQTGRYDLAIGRLLAILGAASVAALAVFIGLAARRPA